MEKVKLSALRTLVAQNSFNNSGGMFVPYQFIAVVLSEGEKPYFYTATVVSANSWTNYDGHKIWHNNQEGKCLKSEVLTDAIDGLRELSENPDFYYCPKFEIV